LGDTPGEVVSKLIAAEGAADKHFVAQIGCERVVQRIATFSLKFNEGNGRPYVSMYLLSRSNVFVGPIVMLWDTGAEFTAINGEFANSLGWKPEQGSSVISNGFGGDVPTRIFYDCTIMLVVPAEQAPIVLPRVSINVVDIVANGKFVNAPKVLAEPGVLGMNVISLLKTAMGNKLVFL